MWAYIASLDCGQLRRCFGAATWCWYGIITSGVLNCVIHIIFFFSLFLSRLRKSLLLARSQWPPADIWGRPPLWMKFNLQPLFPNIYKLNGKHCLSAHVKSNNNGFKSYSHIVQPEHLSCLNKVTVFLSTISPHGCIIFLMWTKKGGAERDLCSFKMYSWCKWIKTLPKWYWSFLLAKCWVTGSK